jgi:hypothetical protein
MVRCSEGSLPVVNNTGDACITGVIDTSEACITGINDTGKVVDHYWSVSMTPAKQDLASINETHTFIAGCTGTNEVRQDTELIRC